MGNKRLNRLFQYMLIFSLLLAVAIPSAMASSLEEELLEHDIVVDNTDPGVIRIGTWTASTGSTDRYGINYEHVQGTTSTGQEFIFNPVIPEQGMYDVYLVWNHGNNKATNVPVEINHNGESDTVTVNQRPGGTGGKWNLIGSFEFAAGSDDYIKIGTEGTNGFVVADAVRLVPQFEPTPAPVPSSDDATLSGLIVDRGAITFDPDVQIYQVKVPVESTTSINITPTAASSKHKGLTVNGNEHPSGTPYNLDLPGTETTVEIKVTAEDDTQLTYLLQIVKMPALLINLGPHDIIVDNADSDRIVRTGAWTTSTNTLIKYGANYEFVVGSADAEQQFQFNPEIPEAGQYTVYLVWSSSSNRANNVPVEIFHNGETSAVTVSQSASGSGGDWRSIGTFEFAEGLGNSITLKAQNANGYVIVDAVRLVPQFTPTPPPPSSDATLSGLSIQPGTLLFDPEVLEYSLAVPLGTESVSITPTAASSVHQSLTINGTPHLSGVPYSADVTGETAMFKITVTAEDGNELTYELEVVKMNNDATLSDMTINPGILDFDPATLSYVVEAEQGQTGVVVTPTASSSEHKSLKVNGMEHPSGETAAIDLSGSVTVVNITVTAQDETVKTYTIIFVKQGKAPFLSQLTISPGKVPFSPFRTAYYVVVGNSLSSLDIKPTAGGIGDSMTVNGEPHTSGAVYTANLSEGINTVTIVIEAQDGVSMTYTLQVERLAHTASAQSIGGASAFPAEQLAKALGIPFYKDESGLLVFSRDEFDFTGSEDEAIKQQLIRLLSLQLTLNGKPAQFFNPEVYDYRLLLNPDGSIPVIGLESYNGLDYSIMQAQAKEEPTVLQIEGLGDYSFTFVEDPLADIQPSDIASIKLTIEGVEEEEMVPTWIPIISVLSNDGYANVNTPDKTIDNDLNTRWSTTSDGETKWLMYDFGEKKTVHSMSAAGYLGDERSYNFEVEISDDGENWELIKTDLKTSGTTLNPEMYSLDNVETRYIRLMCYGYSAAKSGWNGFSEIRFYNSAEQAALDESKWDDYFSNQLTYEVGENLQLELSGLTSGGKSVELNSENIVFVSSDTAVAQVDSDGTVTITGAGEAKITVMVTHGTQIQFANIDIVAS